MPFSKNNKRILLVLGALIVIQSVWFLVVQRIVDSTQLRTTATVIRIDERGSSCSGRGPCDGSNILIPVYEFYDTSGKRHEKSDRYFGEYKKANPLRILFGKKVGDTATTYYEKDKPEEALFMANPLAYAAWLLPLYAVIFSFVVYVVIKVFRRLRRFIS